MVLWRELRTLSPHTVAAQMEGWGAARVAAALCLSAVVYLLLAANEALALRWFGGRVRLRDILGVSFVAYAFGNTIGFNLLVASAVRVKGYRRYGVDLPMVAATSLCCSAAFWLGLATLTGLSLAPARPGLGAALLLAPAVGIGSCAVWRRPITGFGRAWPLPTAGRALALVLIGVLVNLALAGVIWVLLDDVGYLGFTGAYAASFALGLVSGVPGGLGVFESAMLTLLPGLDRAALAAAFVGYRLFYFLIPLIFATAVMLVREEPWRSRQP